MTSLSDIFRNSVQSILNSVHTCLPAVVLDFDPKTNKAKVQVTLNKAYFSGVVEMPIMENVPVMFPKNIYFPLEKGDYVLLLFAERSIELWLNHGGIVTPDDPRKFNLSDAIALTGLQPFNDDFSNRNVNNFQISYKNSSINIKPNGDIIIETANKVAIGNQTAELLKIVSDLLGFLSTSITRNATQGIQGSDTDTISPLFYSNLKAQLETIRATIP